ncbi:MAG: mandelate racemase [Pseudolabrys sp.]|nr:mandelate racemase [Pseudolabrys sp.]
MSQPLLTIRAIRATPVEVPLNFVLGTSAEAIRRVPLLLVDVETEEGITGRTYIFCYLRAAAPAIASLLGAVETAVKGERLEPEKLFAKLKRRFTLIGVQGIVRMAIAAFDTAAWDALAIAAKQPLASVIGAAPRPVLAYNSCGLGLTRDKGALAAEAEKLLERGFRAVKLRLGHASLEEDLNAIHAVKARVGEGVRLMVDYNQGLSAAEAMTRGRALDKEGLYWLEEPVGHDDYAAAKALAASLTLPIQLGENFSLPEGMSSAMAHRCCDYVMPDLERIGGVTGWREAAQIAAVNRLPMSSHLFPEVSAHLLAATPTCHYLEYVDWADAILEEPLVIKDGHAIIPQRPGNGMVWNTDAVKHLRFD